MDSLLMYIYRRLLGIVRIHSARMRAVGTVVKSMHGRKSGLVSSYDKNQANTFHRDPANRRRAPSTIISHECIPTSLARGSVIEHTTVDLYIKRYPKSRQRIANGVGHHQI